MEKHAQYLYGGRKEKTFPLPRNRITDGSVSNITGGSILDAEQDVSENVIECTAKNLDDAAGSGLKIVHTGVISDT